MAPPLRPIAPELSAKEPELRTKEPELRTKEPQLWTKAQHLQTKAQHRLTCEHFARAARIRTPHLHSEPITLYVVRFEIEATVVGVEIDGKGLAGFEQR